MEKCRTIHRSTRGDATVLLELAKMHKEGIVDQDFNNPQVLLTFC
jgi:hypothetical protein